MKVEQIEKELADWWLERRVLMEEQISLQRSGAGQVVGVDSNVDPAQDPLNFQLWRDLTENAPTLPDELPAAAREMKATRYMEMFEDATDIHHPCRQPGLLFLRCQREHFRESKIERDEKCKIFWPAFEQCRQEVFEEQKKAAIKFQETWRQKDKRASELWKERAHLLAHSKK